MDSNYTCELVSQKECKITIVYTAILPVKYAIEQKKIKKKKYYKIFIFVGQDNELYSLQAINKSF